MLGSIVSEATRGAPRRTIDVLKVDCEGCEYALLASMPEWLVPAWRQPGYKLRLWRWRTKPWVARLVGELHLNVLAPSYAGHAPRPASSDLMSSLKVLWERGCEAQWGLEC